MLDLRCILVFLRTATTQHQTSIGNIHPVSVLDIHQTPSQTNVSSWIGQGYYKTFSTMSSMSNSMACSVWTGMNFPGRQQGTTQQLGLYQWMRTTYLTHICSTLHSGCCSLGCDSRLGRLLTDSSLVRVGSLLNIFEWDFLRTLGGASFGSQAHGTLSIEHDWSLLNESFLLILLVHTAYAIAKTCLSRTNLSSNSISL